MLGWRDLAIGTVTLAFALTGSPAVVAGIAAGAARTPDEPAVRAVTIDAVVTNAKGLPILDLKAADFELRENGVLRSIAGVELRTTRRDVLAADMAPIGSPLDEERAARQPGTRVFAIFLDEFHVSPGTNSERVRTALTRYIDDQLQPADLAIVIKPLDSLTSLRFTRDRSALRAAVGSFAGRKGDYAPHTPFEEEYIGRAPVAVEAARVQIVTAALRALAVRFGDLRADRGVLVVVSEGFARSSFPGPAGRASRAPDLQGVVRAASLFHLSVYTFNPGDSQTDESTVDSRQSSVVSRQSSVDSRQSSVVSRQSSVDSRQSAGADGAVAPRDTPVGTLQWLAAQTGGQAVLDGRTLGAGLRRMTDDLSAYYVLTYQSGQADGRFHSFEVRAKRGDALVRTAPGYWAPLGSDWRTAVASSAQRFGTRRALHRSTLIDVWTGVTRGADGRTRLSVTWEPRSSAPHPPAVVVLKARTAAGAELFDGNVAHVGAAGAARDRAVFDAPGGRIELDLTVLGLDGTKLDLDTRDIDVPVLDARTNGPVLLTPEILRARSVREFRAASTNPDATPTPDRTFSRSDRLLIRVPVWDASGTGVQVSASILNRWGQPMRAIAQSVASPGLAFAQFDLPLSWLAPGDYLISLTAKNAHGDATERVSIRVER